MLNLEILESSSTAEREGAVTVTVENKNERGMRRLVTRRGLVVFDSQVMMEGVNPLRLITRLPGN